MTEAEIIAGIDRQAERDAVVAWLRDEADRAARTKLAPLEPWSVEVHRSRIATLRGLADRIERGDHLRPR